MKTLIPHILAVAGFLQLAVSAGSLSVPFLLKWKQQLSGVRPLTKQLFLTYAGYIVSVNTFFGVVSLMAARQLSDGTPLAILLTGFIALYWLVRVLIQFFYFDRRDFPHGLIYHVAEIVLVTCFIFLAMGYTLVFCYNLTS
jgi:hypothetical protein